MLLPLVLHSLAFTLSTRLPGDSVRASGPGRRPTPSASADEALPPIEVYTTPGCTYCARAKKFFKRYGLPYSERDVTASEAELAEMMKRASSATLPQIFVAGELVGGYENMLAEYEAGRLEPLLERAGLQMQEPKAVEEVSDADFDAPSPAELKADAVLNPAMGAKGGSAEAAARTSAAMQRCMLALMDSFLDDDGARVRYGALRASPEFAEFVMTAEGRVSKRGAPGPGPEGRARGPPGSPASGAHPTAVRAWRRAGGRPYGAAVERARQLGAARRADGLLDQLVQLPRHARHRGRGRARRRRRAQGLLHGRLRRGVHRGRLPPLA